LEICRSKDRIVVYIGYPGIDNHKPQRFFIHRLEPLKKPALIQVQYDKSPVFRKADEPFRKTQDAVFIHFHYPKTFGGNFHTYPSCEA
jgi:hypothetical protein